MTAVAGEDTAVVKENAVVVAVPISIKGVKTNISFDDTIFTVEIKDRGNLDGGSKKSKKAGGNAPKMSIPLGRVLNVSLPTEVLPANVVEQEAAIAEEGSVMAEGGTGVSRCFRGSGDLVEKDLVDGGGSAPSTSAKESWSAHQYSITFLTADAKPKELAKQVKVMRMTPLCTVGAEALHNLFAKLEQLIYPDGPLTLTSFVSPASGSGKAVKLWATVAMPILKFSRHTIKTIETTRRYHAHDYCADPANEFDATKDVVVAAGGDGMLFELLNGFKIRGYNKGSKFTAKVSSNDCDGNDHQKKQEEKTSASSPSSSSVSVHDVSLEEAEGYDFSTVENGNAIPRLATFPCGSGCAMAASLDVISLIDAALAMVHCHSVGADVMRAVPVPTTRNPTPAEVKQANKDKKPPPVPTLVRPDHSKEPPVWSFLSFIAGFLADIDKESEKWRWMGNARFTVYALSSIISSVPNAECTIRYLPWTYENSMYADPVAAKKALGGHDWGAAADTSPTTLTSPGITCRLDSECACQTLARKSSHDSGVEGTISGTEWVTLDSTTLVVNTLNCSPYLAQDMVFAPFKHLAGGMIDIAIADGNKKPSRTDVLSVIVEAEAGTQMVAKTCEKAQGKNPMRTIRAKKVCIQPHEGLIGADGEYFPFRGYVVESEVGGARFVRTRLPKGHHWPAAHKK